MLSAEFVKKVINKAELLDSETLRDFISKLSIEYELYQAIFESMIEGLIVVDEYNLIKYMNKNACRFLNLNVNTIWIDQNLFDIIEIEELKSLIRNSLIKQKTIKDLEYSFGYPQENVLKINIFPLVLNDIIMGNIIMLLDITEQKEESEKLKRAESLASLTTLAAGVAHEIKNPLSAMDFHVQILEKQIDRLHKTKKEDLIDTTNVIAKEIDRLNNIIKDFLFSVKPMKLEEQCLDIRMVFEEIISLLKYEITENNLNVHISQEDNVEKVYGDISYLKQAFLNLLKNAIEASSEGDFITINIYQEDEKVNIEIQDTGKGISIDILKKIFEPYFTTKSFGTGLGLTIVYKIIREHGGTIKVSTKESVGTTFIIILPVHGRSKKLLPDKQNVNEIDFIEVENYETNNSRSR